MTKAQPTSLTEATDTTWQHFDLQIFVSGTDTAWVQDRERNTLWYAKWNDRHILDCGFMQPAFDLEDMVSDAKEVLRGLSGTGINDPFMSKAECVVDFYNMWSASW